MKSIQAEYSKEPFDVKIKDNAEPETWPAVCARFNDDVQRICDVDTVDGYTGLYQCCDDNNEITYYLVDEDKSLYKLKRRHFFNNIGYEK